MIDENKPKMPSIEQMREAIAFAATKKSKAAMFFLNVERYADELDGAGALEFCKAVGVPASYATEYKKALALAKLKDSLGIVQYFPNR